MSVGRHIGRSRAKPIPIVLTFRNPNISESTLPTCLQKLGVQVSIPEKGGGVEILPWGPETVISRKSANSSKSAKFVVSGGVPHETTFLTFFAISWEIPKKCQFPKKVTFRGGGRNSGIPTFGGVPSKLFWSKLTRQKGGFEKLGSGGVPKQPFCINFGGYKHFGQK